MKIISIHKNQNIEKLIPQLKTQDRLAQKELYERCARKMLGVCRNYLTDLHHAEDCMMKGFLKVFAKIDGFKSEGSFDGWMRRIMVNECLDFIKLNKSMVYLDEIGENFSETEEEIESSFNAQELLDRLPDNYRTVFNLFVLEDYSHKEISELLNISESASKLQLLRAKNKLREFILEQKQQVNEN